MRRNASLVSFSEHTIHYTHINTHYTLYTRLICILWALNTNEHTTHIDACVRGGLVAPSREIFYKVGASIYLCRSYIPFTRALPKMFQKNVTAAISFDFWPPTEEALRIQRERCAVQAFLLSLYAIYTVRSRTRHEYHPHIHSRSQKETCALQPKTDVLLHCFEVILCSLLMHAARSPFALVRQQPPNPPPFTNILRIPCHSILIFYFDHYIAIRL